VAAAIRPAETSSVLINANGSAGRMSGRTLFKPRVIGGLGRLKLGRGGSKYAAAEDLRERPGLGLDDKLDAKDFPAADRGGAKRAWLAALMVEPRPHLIHSGGQVTVDGDLDNVQHERDSAWGERNSTLAHLMGGEHRFIVISR
jgi:hypothetical protein